MSIIEAFTQIKSTLSASKYRTKFTEKTKPKSFQTKYIKIASEPEYFHKILTCDCSQVESIEFDLSKEKTSYQLSGEMLDIIDRLLEYNPQIKTVVFPRKYLSKEQSIFDDITGYKGLIQKYYHNTDFIFGYFAITIIDGMFAIEEYYTLHKKRESIPFSLFESISLKVVKLGELTYLTPLKEIASIGDGKVWNVDSLIHHNPQLKQFSTFFNDATPLSIEKFPKDVMIENKMVQKAIDTLQQKYRCDDTMLALALLAYKDKHYIPSFEIEERYLVTLSSLTSKPIALYILEQFPKKDIDFHHTTLYLSGTPLAYQITELKKHCPDYHITLTKKIEMADYVVLGIGHKVLAEDLQGKEIVSIAQLETFITTHKQMTLVEAQGTQQEHIYTKLCDLLISSDEQNNEIALNLMREGGVPIETLPYMAGTMKAHPNPKIRKKASVLIDKYGGEFGKTLKNTFDGFFIYQGEELSKMEIEMIEKLDNFDTGMFAYYLSQKRDMAYTFLM